MKLVDRAGVSGANVGLIGRRELLRSRLRADTVRADFLGSRLESRALLCSSCSNCGGEEPGSKGQHYQAGCLQRFDSKSATRLPYQNLLYRD
jgi:hypothetical protein